MDSHKTSVVAGGGARFKEYLDRTKMEHKQYQYEGVQWMLNNELRADPVAGVRGGFIADEMGLGKTIMMIGTMLCNFRARTLIVVPPVLVDQWYAQIYRTTGHKPLIYHGNKKKQISQFLLSQATIVITTYGAITLTKKQIDANAITPLHQLLWGRIIFDEAHHLRNKNTTRYISARKLQANIRWLVSGTPVQNRRQDFYSLCSLLGLPASFYTEVDNLPKLTADFVLKRTKTGVGIRMPNVVHDKNMVTWGNRKEMELSEEIHSALAFSHVSASKSRAFVANSLSKGSGVLSLLLRARQTCIYPKLLSKTLTQNENLSAYSEAFNCSSKLDFAVEKILRRKDNGCGKLIFCHFREEIDEIAARLRAGGMAKVGTFDGRTTGGKRTEALHNKNDALILQIQTGCEGLNLQENYSEIYFISPHWNPAIEDQAVARCHRIGQTKPVYVERFEMSPFISGEDDKQLPTRTVDNYVGVVQAGKRAIAQECI
jgi:SNF2 family DNA or RNA helicase